MRATATWVACCGIYLIVCGARGEWRGNPGCEIASNVLVRTYYQAYTGTSDFHCVIFFVETSPSYNESTIEIDKDPHVLAFGHDSRVILCAFKEEQN